MMKYKLIRRSYSMRMVLIAALVALTMVGYAAAQDDAVGFSADFDACEDMPMDWVVFSADDDANNTWSCGTAGEQTAVTANAFGAEAAANDWLISPAIDVSEIPDAALSFFSWTQYGDANYPSVTVLYSTDYSGSGDPTDATWTTLDVPTFSDADSQQWTPSGDIDLSDVDGEMYIAFQYESTGTGGGSAASWAVDNVTVAPASEEDVELTLQPMLIHDIQGGVDTYGVNSLNEKLDASPEVGSLVEITGIVIADMQEEGELDRFYMQEETDDQDDDPTTSEGISVACTLECADVSVGDQVTVVGEVEESFNLTQIAATDNLSVEIIASDQLGLTEPAVVSFPLGAATSDTGTDGQEAYEAMWVRVDTPMHATEYFNYDRFSELRVWTDGTDADRPYTYSAVGDVTDTEAFEQAQRDFVAESIIIDDGLSGQNIAPKPYPSDFLLDNSINPENGFRGGDTLEAGWEGVMDYSFDSWRIHVYDASQDASTDGDDLALTFTNSNPRPDEAPEVGGTLTVASFNVLNYFTGIDQGDPICGPDGNQDCRGADSESEFERQEAKIVNAMAMIDADVFGLMEIENNGTAVATLAEALNESVGEGTYDYIDTGVIGTDAIAVALIYKPDAVQPVGTTAELDSDAFVDPNGIGDPKNRAALVQAFEDVATGEQFVVIVNHLKSKGSECGEGDDSLVQGNCNGTRTAAVNYLLDSVLTSDPTGTGESDVLIIGDLNAYDNEDPITTLEAAGYTDLTESMMGETAYGYVFDGRWGRLDYAMSSESLTPFVTGAADVHINADEPDAIDYDESFNPSGWYTESPYRSSDHDPVIVGLDLAGSE